MPNPNGRVVTPVELARDVADAIEKVRRSHMLYRDLPHSLSDVIDPLRCLVEGLEQSDASTIEDDFALRAALEILERVQQRITAC